MKKLLGLVVFTLSILGFGFASNTGTVSTGSHVKAIVKKVETKKVIKKYDKKPEVKKVEKTVVKTNKAGDAVCGSDEISVSSYTYTISKGSNKGQKVSVPSYCRKVEKKK